jgi:hypothetical protein
MAYRQLSNRFAHALAVLSAFLLCLTSHGAEPASRHAPGVQWDQQQPYPRPAKVEIRRMQLQWDLARCHISRAEGLALYKRQQLIEKNYARFKAQQEKAKSKHEPAN